MFLHLAGLVLGHNHTDLVVDHTSLIAVADHTDEVVVRVQPLGVAGVAVAFGQVRPFRAEACLFVQVAVAGYDGAAVEVVVVDRPQRGPCQLRLLVWLRLL